jgi:outer membrane protein TolC
VGPFHYTDVRAYASWNAFDYSARKNYQAAQQNQRAAQLSVSDARDLVVQAAANGYLQIIRDASRVEATRSQVATALALYSRTDDQRRAGTAAAIDVLRAQVELKQQQQRLLAQTNQLDKDKLVLGRIIGLPDRQAFNLSESVPFAALPSMTLEEAFATASTKRPDLQGYEARVRAAEETVKAARAERYPTADISANYGAVGTTLASSHGTFEVAATARVNVFNGGRIAGDIVQAQAQLKERQDELADLNGLVKQQIRSAFLDIRTAADQVAVARDNLEFANQTLVQSRDRFAAGVTDNIEVVQAQESVAVANNDLISALYAHNVAKVELGRALGGAEQGVQRLLEVKQQ